MENDSKEIAFEPDFRDAFMNVQRFLSEASLPIELVYQNKKPKDLPESISNDWDTIQAFYEQEKKREEETGDIILV